MSMETGRTGSELGTLTASVEKVHVRVDSLGIREQKKKEKTQLQTTTQAGQARRIHQINVSDTQKLSEKQTKGAQIRIQG